MHFIESNPFDYFSWFCYIAYFLKNLFENHALSAFVKPKMAPGLNCFHKIFSPLKAGIEYIVANQQTSKPENQQTSKPANQQTSKPANQQTSKPAHKQASKQVKFGFYQIYS